MNRPCSRSQASPGSKPWACRLFCPKLVAMSSVQPITTHVSLCLWLSDICGGSGTGLYIGHEFYCETDIEDGSCEGGRQSVRCT